MDDVLFDGCARSGINHTASQTPILQKSFTYAT
jgi:hypothetical protein